MPYCGRFADVGATTPHWFEPGGVVRLLLPKTQYKGIKQMPHLTYENRLKIEILLAKSKSIRFIALQIGVSHTTILREIKKHRIASFKTFGIYILNNCIYRKKCSEKNICSLNTRQGELPSFICKQKCSACREINCNSYCEKFVAEKCDRLINSPGVCNGCNLERKCSLSKYYYISEEAEK